VISVAWPIRLHNIYDTRSIKLSLEFEVVSVLTIFLFRATYCSEQLPLKHKKLVFLPFSQHPCLTAIQHDRADQSLANDYDVLLDVDSGFSSVTPVWDPKFTNALTISQVLSSKATLWPTSRIVLSFPSILRCSLLFPALETCLGLLLGSYRWCRYHRRYQVFVFTC
jgi:hypothetical protein